MESNCLCFPKKYQHSPERLTTTSVGDWLLRSRRTKLEKLLDARSANEDDRLELQAILVEQLDRAKYPLGMPGAPDSGPADYLADFTE